MFGCAWKIKFFGKTFQLTVCFRLWPGNWFTFLFSLQTISKSQTCKERERELPIHPKPIAPQHRRRHLDRTTTEISPQTSLTPPRSHHHGWPIHPKPISSASSLPMTNLVAHDRSRRPLVVTHDRSRCPLYLISISSLPMTDLIAHDPWPISSPMTHDRSLPFPQFLITLSSSLFQFDRIMKFNEWCCFDFCFFKFIYWNFLL